MVSAVGTGAAIGTAVLPGIGTIIGSIAGVLTSALNILGTQNAANDQFVNSCLQAAQNLGIKGLTNEDIVHLLPGRWGTDRSNALNVLDYYFGVIQGTKTGLNGQLLTPGQDAQYQLDFGGGYQPGHSIYYSPTSVSPQIISATQSTTIPPSSQSSILPSGSTGNILLIVGIAAVLYILSQKG